MTADRVANPHPNDSRLQAAAAKFESAPREAQIILEQVLASDPEDFMAMRMLAKVFYKLGNAPAATRHELEAIKVGIARKSFIAAQDAFLADDLDQAEVLIRAHLRQDPQDPAAAVMLAEIAARCGATNEADNLFNRAILQAPSYIEARSALAKHQRSSGRYEQALQTISSILAIAPDHLSALALKASILEQLRRFDEADAAFQDLHDRHPLDARGWSNHAFMLKTTGRREDAVSAYRKALEIDPAYGLAWWGLSNLKTVKFNESDIAAMQTAIAGSAGNTENKVHLLYALGKALDDGKQYAEAFAAYDEGAAMRLEQVPYDPDKVKAHIRKSREVCTGEFFEARNGWGYKAKDPIFIVSLPRSGSTLIEQILASHPMVEGTEELHDIERIAISLAPDAGTGGWLDVLPNLSSEQVSEIGRHYVEATRRHRRTDRPFFTDKMPSNWVFLGLIHSALPNAKIIDVRRHPLGCGFANFSQHFNWGINFSYDLDHIGRFYSTYVELLSHFDRAVPNLVHHVTYEALVEDTEAEIRKLLNYLDLPFADECLRFFENKRAVYTPSSEQVRSPINREGMERWKNYEPFLQPLKASLGPVLDCYPAPPSLKEL